MNALWPSDVSLLFMLGTLGCLGGVVPVVGPRPPVLAPLPPPDFVPCADATRVNIRVRKMQLARRWFMACPQGRIATIIRPGRRVPEIKFFQSKNRTIDP